LTPIYSLQRELPENKGVLLPSLSIDQKIFLPQLAVMLKLKISVFLPAYYLFRVKEFTIGAITFVLRGPA
jgi:hypothetical protein